MTTEAVDSERGLLSRLPFAVQLGLVVGSWVYAAAILTDTVNDPIPDDVWAVVWFTVAAYLLARLIHRNRPS